jgi:hypothetical protein
MFTSQCISRVHKRRWFQCIRVALLVFMLLASTGTWFTVRVQRAKRQEDAVEAIRGFWGFVAYDYEQVPGSAPPGPDWMRRLFGEDFFATAVGVALERKLNGPVVTDAALVHVKALHQLEWLALDDAQITDDGLQQINGMTQLRYLWLSHTPITDLGLEHLKGMTGLQLLGLSSTKITDAGLASLKAMGELRDLDLYGTRITDEGLLHLKGMVQLQGVGLGGTQVTEEGVKSFQQALPDCRVSR